VKWGIRRRGIDAVDLQAIIIIALAVALAGVAVDRFNRWWLRRSVQRLAAKVQRDMDAGVYQKPRLVPESLYVTRLDDVGVTCTDPDGGVEAVEWADLQSVEIVTTDHGPFLPDVFWVLHGSRVDCVVPQGASGDEELRDRLQGLPGFRHDEAIAAMSSTANRRFLCWEKASGA
jgi:hypothetical protein